MRRVAALADVHGNLPALEAVLEEVRQAEPDLVVFCGDVALGFLETETIDALRELALPKRFVRGNCETEMLAQQRPDADRAGFLAEFEPQVRVDVDARVLAPPEQTPALQNDLHNALQRALPDLRNGRFSITKIEPERDERGTVVAYQVFVNAGSVGRPYGEAGAFWALLGPSIVLRRTVYDLDAAARRLRDTEWAEDAATAATPPSREEAIAVFEKAAGRGTVLA